MNLRWGCGIITAMKKDFRADFKHYLTTLGMEARAMERALRKHTARDLALVQPKIEAYQKLLHVDQKTVVKLIAKFPAMLGYDVDSDSPTSVKNKMQNFQTILQIDARTVEKMIIAAPQILGFDTINDTPTSIKSKVKDYQRVLHADDKTLRHMVTIFPNMLGYDVVSDSPTSTANKVQFLKAALGVDDQTLLQMLVKAPVLLAMDTTGTGPSSLSAKIAKLNHVIPADKLRECITTCPMVFTVPAQAFKIRYLLAENVGAMGKFLKKGFMTNQNKVWARACYFSRFPSVYNPNNVYRDEKQFSRCFGVKSVDLMQRYPLDQAAVYQIEKTYLMKTGNLLTLDQQERAAIGLEK